MVECNTINEVAKVVADWWCDTLCNPNFIAEDKSAVSEGLAVFRNRNIVPVTEEQKEKLNSAIFNLVLQNVGTTKGVYSLDVDYVPCVDLMSIIKDCDISYTNLPIKAFMIITHEFVEVALNGSRNFVILYGNKD